MSGLPDGVVFDCDGTIADTETLSSASYREVLARHGYAWTDHDTHAIIGQPGRVSWPYILSLVEVADETALREELRAAFHGRFDTELAFFDDAVSAIRDLVGHGVPVAVASSSSHGHIDAVLARAGLDELVPVRVGADDVDEHKPLPRPYLCAAELLGVDPERCSAVEDTPIGVAAAVAAGMWTVAVRRHDTDPEPLAEADMVVDHLTLSHLHPQVRTS